MRENIVLLVGGVGGAKLAVGMAHVLPPGALTIIVNTADDLEHLGLHISPDLDTVMYTLSDLTNPQTGWGVADDTFQAVDMVARYAGPSWFRLGDKDLGTNLMRTMLLQQGHTLTEVTLRLCKALGIEHTLLPMTDSTVRTILETDQGTLGFQEYFVRERWQPVVRSLRFEGSEDALLSDQVAEALDNAKLVVFGPSNPMLSIAPILSIPGIRERISRPDVPCVAVSPIIGGRAVKGPAAKLMEEFGMDVSPVGVAEYYQNLLDGIILDEGDSVLCEKVESMNIRASAQRTFMETQRDKIKLAEGILRWVEENLL